MESQPSTSWENTEQHYKKSAELLYCPFIHKMGQQENEIFFLLLFRFQFLNQN